MVRRPAVLLLVLACWGGGAVQALPLPGARGHRQQVAVVVGRYTNGPEPTITAQEWVDLLKNLANDYFALATGGATSFEFTAVSGTLTFAEPLPAVLGAGTPQPVLSADETIRAALTSVEQSLLDGQQAATYAARRGIDLSTTTRLVVFTGRDSRACSTIGHWLVYKDQLQRPVSLSVAVVPEIQAGSSPAFDPAVALAPGVLSGATDALGRVQALLRAGNGTMAMATVLHEMGHSLGLLDAYREFVPDGEDDYTWFWTLMGRQEGQHVDAFNRQQIGWLPADRVATLAPPLGQDLDVGPIRLAPAYRGGNGAYEALRLSFGPAPRVPGTSDPYRRANVGPFHGLYLEARTPSSADRSNLDNNLVSFRQPYTGDTITCSDGVVVTLCREGLPLGSTIVLPSSRQDWLTLAAFRAPEPGASSVGTVYTSGRATHAPTPPGIRVEVVDRTGDTFRVRVHWGLPPAPDLELYPGLPGDSPDLWLDSPANGWDRYQFPSRAFDDGTSPQFSGDLPLITYSVPMRPLYPGGPRVPSGPPELQRVGHRIHVRLRNNGSRAAVNVRGHVVVVERPSLVDVDPARPETLLRLGGDDRVFEIPRLEPGHVVDQVIEGFEPRGGPFTMFCWLEPARGDNGQMEWNALNQLATKFVVFYQTSMGSPYQPVTVPLQITNFDSRQQRLVFCAVPSDLPAGWDLRQDRLSAQADPGGSVGYQVTVQPPETDKPPARRMVRLRGYASHGDSFIPLGEVPVHVQLGTRSQTRLAVKASGKEAQLTGSVSPAAADLPVVICVTDSAGGTRFAGSADGRLAVLNTTGRGNFGANLVIDPALSYVAVATFAGDEQRLASRSDPVPFGAPTAAPRPRPRP